MCERASKYLGEFVCMIEKEGIEVSVCVCVFVCVCMHSKQPNSVLFYISNTLRFYYKALCYVKPVYLIPCYLDIVP